MTDQDIRNLRRQVDAQTAVIEALYRQLAEVHREIVDLKSAMARINLNGTERQRVDSSH